MSDEFTGERVIPGLVDINLLNEHLSRYEFAKRFAAGKRVLDAGCGTGYGAAELAKVAREVTGIDVSEEAVDFARANYAAANLRFEPGLCTALPGGPYDLITAFEVIEHLEDWRGLLSEARRVLAPGGRFLVSTPNKSYYTESRGSSGANPFHVHEFDYPEFDAELRNVFPHVMMYLQNHAEGVIFQPVADSGRVAAEVAESGAVPADAHFFVAVCGDVPQPSNDVFVWVPTTANILRERERHIELQTKWLAQRQDELDVRNREYQELLAKVRELNSELKQRNEWALACQAEADRRGRVALEQQEEFAREAVRFRDIASSYEKHLLELEEINRAKTEWAFDTERRLTAEIAARTRELAECVEILHSVEKTVEERTLWAQGLDRELEQWRQRFGSLRGSAWVRLGNRLKLVDSR